MDMHPTGLPRLVGPEGVEFPHSDVSSQFRYLPNNVTDEIPVAPPDVLHFTSRIQPLHVRASPVSPRSPAPHPIRLREEHPKPGSPRDASSPHLLLPPEHKPPHLTGSDSKPPFALPPSPRGPPVHTFLPPTEALFTEKHEPVESSSSMASATITLQEVEVVTTKIDVHDEDHFADY